MGRPVGFEGRAGPGVENEVLQQIEGMVLKAGPYGESHRTAALLTSNFSLLRVFARGGQSPGRPLHGASSPGARAVFTIRPFPDGTAEIRHAAGIRQLAAGIDPLQLAGAGALLELAHEVAKGERPGDGISLFRFFDRALSGLQKGSPPRRVVAHASFRCFRPLGVGMDLRHCVGCAAELDQADWFSSARGGPLCGRCAPSDRSAGPLDSAVYRCLVWYAGSEDPAVPDGPGVPDEGAVRGADPIVRVHLQEHGAVWLRSLRVLDRLEQGITM